MRQRPDSAISVGTVTVDLTDHDGIDQTHDAALLAASRAGNSTAFAALYKTHHRAAARYARRLIGTSHAEDLVAEAFTRIWHQLSEGRGPHSAVMPYLRATLLNLHIRQLRREHLYVWVDDVHSAAVADAEVMARLAELNPEAIVLQQLFTGEMMRALETLPARYQQALIMVYIENRPYPQVASKLGLSIPGTRKLAHRARQRMREALTELLPDPDSPHDGHPTQPGSRPAHRGST